MNNTTLTKKLRQLAAAASEVFVLWSEIEEHSIKVYGCTPSDVDCDEFIDTCTGTNGACSGMTAAEFNKAMKFAIKLGTTRVI